MNNKYSYTFIIPHHNCPELLNRCLNSLPAREDIQIIVVDDASDEDKIPNIKRTDIEVYYVNNKETKGAGKARNVGLMHAKGRWLIFADADDFFEENVLAILDKYKDDIYDIVFFKIRSVNSDTLKPIERCKSFNLYIDNFRFHKFFSEGTLRYIHCVPWGKMIRREIVSINKIIFDEVRYGNDVMFALKCGYNAYKINASSDILYVLTHREGSLVTQVSKTSFMCRAEVNINRSLYLKEHDIHLYGGAPISAIRLAKKLFGTECSKKLTQKYIDKKFTKIDLIVIEIKGFIGGILRHTLGRI